MAPGSIVVRSELDKDPTQVGLAKHDQVLAECCLDIPCAYVIYDRNYRKSVEELRGFARENDIYTIGRYGAWEYSGMEDAIWQGKQVADEILA